MSKRHWHRQLRRLEQAGNDDFLLILTGGAAAYATHELHHLLRRLRLECLRLRELRRTGFRLAVCIPLMLFVACAASLLDLRPIVYGTLAALGCLCVLLAGLQTYVVRRFRHHTRARRLRRIIQQELERRRKDVGAV